MITVRGHDVPSTWWMAGQQAEFGCNLICVGRIVYLFLAKPQRRRTVHRYCGLVLEAFALRACFCSIHHYAAQIKFYTTQDLTTFEI
jgi:hypothetical protein